MTRKASTAACIGIFGLLFWMLLLLSTGQSGWAAHNEKPENGPLVTYKLTDWRRLTDKKSGRPQFMFEVTFYNSRENRKIITKIYDKHILLAGSGEGDVLGGKRKFLVHLKRSRVDKTEIWPGKSRRLLFLVDYEVLFPDHKAFFKGQGEKPFNPKNINFEINACEVDFKWDAVD